ncbi:TIGR00296 family protein [Candidatus Woesearchaeota archaeon]|nr:MAG: TIGR00296 family protein [Candidatus Woesearchaeota archaeon]
MIQLNDAKLLMQLAKRAVYTVFSSETINVSDEIKAKFSNKQGVFVTIKLDGKLRGCIGYPYPEFPLYRAVIQAARGAAFDDPRFPPMRIDEMKNSEFELSILSVPKLINVKKPEEYINHIQIGKDGLIIKGRMNAGLLLPQVATEYGWDETEFLNQVCVKAGMHPNAWHDLTNRVYHFQAQVFKEENGDVVEEI